VKLKIFVVSLLAAASAGIVVAQSANLSSEGKAWWAHVQFLADDKLEGRNVGTPGFDKAVEYVEGQFKAIGLKPAGVNGYRQPVKLDSRVLVPDQTSLVLVRDGKEQPLVVGQDATLSVAASSTVRWKPPWCSSAMGCRFLKRAGTTSPDRASRERSRST
jgi:hypothetical protein